ncbi:5-formyltetrahydrofolate cyclo-ligase [Bacillus velezensis UCMB5036]|uniref:5-formyltetrahydrofolate cyclo-ligase n=1 Tax=Bacillus amyloliquefaciens group TaxID=1938374 RepID=UPI0002B6C969|nr:5-formyltetrahydrofolate cyclo-ligase [Bacillus velezensis]MCY7682155.1 5-formyltetrahydrofolate cyclo-ligase [Bacillus velezensis]PAC79387.1 5-formyltetrahydrofolate cyclo-ligase [Bacillus velezensis]QJC93118.1 5-formyltetrahydrofolate cyclo-ligase [Bacillus velezensis]CCP22280.1 5-formyltetrahydrofolate cyclo-ligase [Bacillus velezensis UCMB5036]
MKAQIRTDIKAKLSDMTESEWEKKCRSMRETLFSLKEWKQARVIAVTISTRLEIPTRPIIEQAWKEKKQVCIPKCFPQTGAMEFRTFSAYDQLETVYAGLSEPIESLTEKAAQKDIDLVIVPGVAFDREGFRIGYGGGYYDRYLSGYKGRTVSLLFDCQLTDRIPRMPHDIPVDKIVTESETIA